MAMRAGKVMNRTVDLEPDARLGELGAAGQEPRLSKNSTAPAKAGTTDVLYSQLPIRHRPGCIRLLEIDHSPRQDSDIVSCRLFVVSGPEEMAYRALSYQWHPEDLVDAPMRTILVNGHAVSVAPNLGDFLSNIGQFQLKEPFWIDALCIDQNNVQERNHQVEMMRSIYLRAACVHIWLGAKYHQTEHLWAYAADGRNEKALSKEHKLEFSKTLQDIQRNPYWTRVWILQEIILAHDIVLNLGNRMIPEDVVFEKFVLRFLRIYTFREEWKSAPEPKGFPLRKLIVRFVDRECSLPLDKVYGLRGLLSPHENMLVDYTITPDELFQRIAESVRDSLHLWELRVLLATVRQIYDLPFKTVYRAMPPLGKRKRLQFAFHIRFRRDLLGYAFILDLVPFLPRSVKFKALDTIF